MFKSGHCLGGHSVSHRMCAGKDIMRFTLDRADCKGKYGEPLFWKVDEIMNKMPLEQYLHETDDFKNYKLRVIAHLRRKGDQKLLKEAIQYIWYNHGVPSWFGLFLPIPAEEKAAAAPILEIEQFNCKYCECSEFHDFGDLVKHVYRKHSREKMPPRELRIHCRKIVTLRFGTRQYE